MLPYRSRRIGCGLGAQVVRVRFLVGQDSFLYSSVSQPPGRCQRLGTTGLLHRVETGSGVHLATYIVGTE
jgi:hypothetical protein